MQCLVTKINATKETKKVGKMVINRSGQTYCRKDD